MRSISFRKFLCSQRLQCNYVAENVTSLGGFAHIFLRVIKIRPQLQQKGAPVGQVETSYQLVINTSCEFNVSLVYAESFYSIFLGLDCYWLAGWLMNRKEAGDVLYPLRYQNEALDGHSTYCVVGGYIMGHYETPKKNATLKPHRGIVKGKSPVVLSSPDIATGLTRLCSLKAPPEGFPYGFLFCNASAQFTAYVAKYCAFVRSAFRDATCDACVQYWCEGRWSGLISAGPHLCIKQCNFLSSRTLGFSFEIVKRGKHEIVLATDQTLPGITILNLTASHSRSAQKILSACNWLKADKKKVTRGFSKCL